MRVFVAVPVPSDVSVVLSALERPSVDRLRWTTPEQWHVTLRFLGEIPDVAPLRDALESLSGEPAVVLVAPPRVAPGAPEAVEGEVGAGVASRVEADLGPVTAWFPGRRVLHVSVHGVGPLARAVATVTEPFGDPEDLVKPFVGHLTLARVHGSRPGPGRLAGVPVHASWPVTHVDLMGSSLGPGGARYETLASVALPR